MRSGYVFSEVLTGLRRNITMTIAMILTTAISLGLLGGGLIVARLTQATQVLYGDKVEVIIYLTTDQSSKDPNCRDSVCQAIQTALKKNAEVELCWKILDPIEEFWAAGGTPEQYPAGSDGPASADALLARGGGAWRRL